MNARRLSLLLTLLPFVLCAHTGEKLEPHDLWTAWKLEPGAVAPLVLSAVLYARGARSSRGTTTRDLTFFWSGWLVLALALVSPLHPLGEALFSAHMAQHEILMLIAAPLLVLSRPLVPMLWGMPMEWRKGAGRWSKKPSVQIVWQVCTAPLAAWWIHAIALWVWHAPRLFQATLESEWVHTAQHLSFFGSALLFWWSLCCARGTNYGAGVLYVFTTAAHTSILGALLTFAPRVWYPAYSLSTPQWGLTPLEDQQIGGLIMWVPAGLIYIVAGLYLFAAWLRKSDAAMVARVTLTLAVMVWCASCARQPVDASIQRGQAAIGKYGCGSCHTIDGISEATGLVGPPLTGIRERVYVAGMLENNSSNMALWIRDPKSFNARTAMPNLGVSAQEAADISNFLNSK